MKQNNKFKICFNCSKTFFKKDKFGIGEKSWQKTKFCSYECYWKNKTFDYKSKKCLSCNKMVYKKDKPTWSRKMWEELKFCSKKCYFKFPKKEETRIKQSNALKGEKSYLYKNGITPYFRIFRMNKIKENGGFHSVGEWENLKAQYNWTCPACSRSEPEIKLTKDHIIPVIKGGSNNIQNIQPLCASCNTRKMVKIIKYKIIDK